MKKADLIWSMIKESVIKKQTTAFTYTSWFSDTKALIDNQRFIVLVPGKIYKAFVKPSLPAVKKQLDKIYEADYKVEVLTEEELEDELSHLKKKEASYSDSDNTSILNTESSDFSDDTTIVINNDLNSAVDKKKVVDMQAKGAYSANSSILTTQKAQAGELKDLAKEEKSSIGQNQSPKRALIKLSNQELQNSKKCPVIQLESSQFAAAEFLTCNRQSSRQNTQSQNSAVFQSKNASCSLKLQEKSKTPAFADTTQIKIKPDSRNKNKNNESKSKSATNYPKIKLNPNYTFDKFVAGEENSFACAYLKNFVKTLSAEQGDERVSRQIILYGPTALGKTHLLQATASAILEENSQFNLIYVRSEDLINEFTYCCKKGDFISFRKKYRCTDLLLIDDLQFIQSKSAFQEEILYTVNSILEAGGSVIFAADTAPTDMQDVSERLMSRIGGSERIKIKKPSFKSRVALLKEMNDEVAAKQGINVLSQASIEYIAKCIDDNCSFVQGAFNKCLTYSKIYGELKEEDLVLVLESYLDEIKDQIVDFDCIMKLTAEGFGLRVEDLLSNSRVRKISQARQMSIYLMKEFFPDKTLREIGKHCERSHSTVIHSISRVEKLLKNDKDFVKRFDDVKNHLIKIKESSKFLGLKK